ncbi:MAG: MEDS domain-containing protein [Thermoproteota archaeon]
MASVYGTVNKFLSEGYAVIYAVEERGVSKNASKSQLINNIYSKMKKSQLIEDIETHIESGALTVVDARVVYSPSKQIDTAKTVKQWISLIKTVRKKGNFKDIAVISDGVTVFSDTNNLDRIIAYERAISESVKKLQSVRVICCYLQESLDTFQFAQLMSIVNTHQCAVGRIEDSEESKKMNSAVMLEAIVDGIEDVLGEGSSKLVMQTMKAVYRINEYTAVSNPHLFQEKMQRLLGSSSKAVLDSASKRIKETLLATGLALVIMATVFSSTILVFR